MTHDWRRLAEFVIRRRAVLGLSQKQVAVRSGLSRDTVQCVEGAKRTWYRPRTLAALERGLDWEHGSVERVLAGGAPVPLAAGGTGRAPARTAQAGKPDPGERLRVTAGELFADIEAAFSQGQVEIVDDVEWVRTELQPLLRRGWMMRGERAAADRHGTGRSRRNRR